MSDKLIIGLGNPGKKYKKTRHNIGFMVADRMGKQFKKYPGCNTLLTVEDSYRVAKPQTFMNKSGKAVKCLLENLPVDKKNILVVVDDFNLPFKKIRYRPGGSAGGHNGLQSVIDYLDTRKFPRLRIGIGGEGVEDKIGYVLSRFNKRELKELQDSLIYIKQSVLYYIKNGIQETMNKYN
ncbi:MAG: aminoacyl-tRNA hydrolase [Elusimicrobiota bacterium]